MISDGAATTGASTRLPNSRDTGGTCPRCGVYANFDFQRLVESDLNPLDDISLDEWNHRWFEAGNQVPRRNHYLNERAEPTTERVLVLVCQRCNKATVVVERFDQDAYEWTVCGHWPQSAIVAPDHLPPKIEVLYTESLSCLGAGAPRAAAIMARTTIDAALQESGAAGRNTQDRIRDMAGKLPQELIDMAHELRLGGNDAAHEFEYKWSIREAQSLVEFLLQLLHHLYEVPQQIKAVRRRTAQRRSSRQ